MLSDTRFQPSRICTAWAMALAACCLAACSAVSEPPKAVATAPVPVEPQAPVERPPVVVLARTPEILAPVLAYADRIRSLQGNELAQEITRLGDAAAPEDQLRLAMALIQTRQLYDLARAQDLLQRVISNQGSDARPLHPLARLLATRFAEQRRIEDQLDRQGQQLRDTQRRLDQTNDKLEALKEIERSLTSRPAASAPASASARSRSRPATP